MLDYLTNDPEVAAKLKKIVATSTRERIKAIGLPLAKKIVRLREIRTKEQAAVEGVWNAILTPTP